MVNMYIQSSSRGEVSEFLRRATLALLVLMVAVMASPTSWAAPGPKSYPYKITTTVGMVTDIVRQVAGEKAMVKGIMGPGVDPHLYRPTRDDVAALMRSDVVFYSGLMLEGKMTDTLVKVARTKPLHAVTELIDEKYLLEPEEMKGHYDPHLWMDPSAWAKAVEAVGQALAEYDRTNADYYRKNAAAFVQQCVQLHAYGQKALATIPEKHRVLITSHDAFNYFGRAFGLKVVGVQGISTESEAGLQRINQLADFILQNDVKAVFVESSVPRKNIQALVQGLNARGKDLRIGGELFSDAMGQEGTYEGTYLGMLDHNITTVTSALGGEVSERGMSGKLALARAP
ncbi:MAG TPA: zinc ABC transporter substrate-binding protein [Clostridia bacterium]|nr:zinc ABC transporter substrate-binding protein [Clostridia bacterium]